MPNGGGTPRAEELNEDVDAEYLEAAMATAAYHRPPGGRAGGWRPCLACAQARFRIDGGV